VCPLTACAEPMKLLLLSVPSILLLAAVDAAPNVIADYRIRNPDITLALGRAATP
jgi:hypothetical protein